MTDKFYCYSTTLMHFLKASGIKYEYKTTHKRTGKRMWVFLRTDDLKLRSSKRLVSFLFEFR